MLSYESSVFVGGNTEANRAGMGPRCFLGSWMHCRLCLLPNVGNHMEEKVGNIPLQVIYHWADSKDFSLFLFKSWKQLLSCPAVLNLTLFLANEFCFMKWQPNSLISLQKKTVWKVLEQPLPHPARQHWWQLSLLLGDGVATRYTCTSWNISKPLILGSL